MCAAALAIFIFYLKRKKEDLSTFQKTALWASGGLTTIFFLMTMFVARRSYDLWAVFGVAFIALIFTAFLDSKPANFKRLLNQESRITAVMAGIILFVFMFAYGVYKNGASLAVANYPYDFRESSEWLKANSKPGEIVVNLYWDMFPKLFFWNTQNRYISGMDPIFQFAYDEQLYWKSYYWNTGQLTNFACSEIECTKEMLEDTYLVLKRDFKASYIIIEKKRSPTFYQYAKEESRFRQTFETETQAVFKVL